jgi:hypothetical protein
MVRKKVMYWQNNIFYGRPLYYYSSTACCTLLYQLLGTYLWYCTDHSRLATFAVLVCTGTSSGGAIPNANRSWILGYFTTYNSRRKIAVQHVERVVSFAETSVPLVLVQCTCVRRTRLTRNCVSLVKVRRTVRKYLVPGTTSTRYWYEVLAVVQVEL